MNDIQARMCRDLIELDREFLRDIESELSMESKEKVEKIRRSLSYIRGCVDGSLEV